MIEPTPQECAWLEQGFTRCPMPGPFVPNMMPVLCRQEGDHLVFRLEVRPQHCNGHGSVHGGFLATLADIWLAYNLIRQLPKTSSVVTASLTVDYLTPAQAGDALDRDREHGHVPSRQRCHAAFRPGEAIGSRQTAVSRRDSQHVTFPVSREGKTRPDVIGG